MATSGEVRVLICDRQGLFLSSKGGTWFLTNKRVLARAFNFHGDQVIAFLERLQKDLDVPLRAVPVNGEILAEICDACGRSLSIRDVLFDGSQFLCRPCRTNTLLGLAAP